MKARDLHKLWSAPDSARLTPQPLALRLPLHVAARVQALCDIYPHKSQTEIIADLLAAALAEVEQSFPPIKGALLGQDEASGGMRYEDVGPSAKYRRLANDYYLAMEKETGSPDPRPLFEGSVSVEGDGKGDGEGPSKSESGSGTPGVTAKK
jgi:hypothetical protein